MASGTLTTSYRGWTYRIYWSSTTDINTNTSTVLCDHWLVMDAAYSISIGARSNTCTVGTDTKAFTSSAIKAKGTTVALGTTSHTVQHGSDGKKTVNLSGSFNVNATLSGVKQNTWTITATLTLDTIPRASVVSLSAYSTPMGNPVTLSITRANTNFKHKLYYHWYAFENGQEKRVLIAENVATQHTWTVPLTFANNLPGTTTGLGTIYCETYNGGTHIGTTSVAFEATVPASVKPTLTMNATDLTGYGATYGGLVSGKSTLTVNVTGVSAYNSPIVSYRTTVDGVEYPGNTFESYPVIGPGVVAVTAQVTDERGRKSDPVSYNFEILPYYPPVVSALSVHRCDQDGTESEAGEYIRATFSAAVSPLGNQNTATYALKYTEHTDGEDIVTTVPLPAISGTYSLTDYSPPPFAANGSHTFGVELSVTDDFGTGFRATSASTAFTLLNFGQEGRNVGVGKVAEKPNAMEVALDHIQTGNSYVMASNGGSTSAGWVRVANIIVTADGTNAPITFVLTRRGERAPMTLRLQLSKEAAAGTYTETFHWDCQVYYDESDNPVSDTIYLNKRIANISNIEWVEDGSGDYLPTDYQITSDGGLVLRGSPIDYQNDGHDCIITYTSRGGNGAATINTFEYEGQLYNTLLRQDFDGVTHDLYVQKTTGDDVVTLQDWWMEGGAAGKVKVTFPGDLVQNPPPEGLTEIPVAAKLQSLIDLIYPVNSIYMSYSNTNPADLFGGTWVRISGRFLLGVATGEGIGQTGGEASHTLTVAEMPSHRHELIRPKWYGTDGQSNYSTQQGGAGAIYGETSTTTPSYYRKDTQTSGTQDVKYTGGGVAHNNMPPYITVSIWRRTA